jgi:hypothetical protein
MKNKLVIFQDIEQWPIPIERGEMGVVLMNSLRGKVIYHGFLP